MYIEYFKKESKGSSKSKHFGAVQHFIDGLISEAEKTNRCKVYLSDDCKRIKIIPADNYDDHYIILAVNIDLSINVAEHSLPDTENNLFPACGSIESYTAMFFGYLEQMEDFYCQMNTIDQLCYVVDPVEITTKSNYRTIKINEKLFLKMILDPLLPSTITPIFYGPTSLVEHYRNLYRDGLDEWNQNDEIYRNLLRIFDIVSFPQKSPQDDSSYCSICYMYRFQNQIPIISCDNDKCSLLYHAICLKQWFSTHQDSKTFLTVTSGCCLFCKVKLSASFVQLLEQ